MTNRFSVFINEHAVRVAPGTSLQAAVDTFDEALGTALSGGSAYCTNGVGRQIDPTTVVEEGAIFRVVKSARRAEG